jgi:hypothetical protein
MIIRRLLAVAVGIVAATVVALAASNSTARLVSFPSAQTQAVARDGRFAVVNVDSDTEPHHTLLLENRQTKSTRKILEYDRSVEVLWNPDSTMFAVNNYAGSNVGECLIFLINKAASVNVGDVLQNGTTNRDEISTLHASDHIYWAAVRWMSPQLLKVKLWGHTDVSPYREFQYYHTYKVRR